ncbi:cell wall-active antibiotics response protein [Chitinophagaceae bacterium LB-8]|uniref:Cell wall-active antibiotics response protein n=1 Tax=Paraflavisolibacter caeni TaxID=2982496 RepID=A0A9X2XPX6_9BACT|nr:LiaF domain-containing protein [Paraflavisolibacter caeni]MCU7552074.1 cell wall-active antibiotics response protein [Paraflavisolibacter caeni]
MEQYPKRGRGHIWAGLFLLIIGSVLLARAMGVFFPGWLLTWPVILIAVGLFIGLKHSFRGPAWFILILVGSAFLADEALPGISLRNYILPFIIIALGILFILRPRRHRHRFGEHWRERFENHRAMMEDQPVKSEPSGSYDFSARGNDFIDITTAFGGVKKIVFSKNLKGGDITTFMGGAEIDLRQADFTDKITIDATNIFGGTKLIIPASWDIQSEIVAIFGGVDDKRQLGGQALDPNKVIRLEGTCLFGGIEIRSF